MTTETGKMSWSGSEGGVGMGFLETFHLRQIETVLSWPAGNSR
jgi:hypothetical protein